MTAFPTLQRGETVGIFSPSSRTEKDGVEKGAEILRQAGYTVHIHPSSYNSEKSFAGKPEERAQALMELWTDSTIKAVMCTRGGNGAADMLEYLDFNLMATQPKVLLGFSDITSLLLAVNKFASTVTFHGPVVKGMAGGTHEHDVAQCFRLLSGMGNTIPLEGGTIAHPGRAEGRMIGGNLSLLVSMLGTGYEPDFQDSILFLEDCDDEASRFHRMAGQLYRASVFSQIKGLVLGQFTDIHETGKIPFEMTIAEIFESYLQRAKFAGPLVTGAPFGHGQRNITLPVGARVTLSAEGDLPGLILPPRP